MEKSENIILIDWLSFSCRCYDPETLAEILGLSFRDCVWDDMGGHNGYSRRWFFGGISICYDGHDERMGVCVEMSGQGCRAYESYGKNDWLGLMTLIRSDKKMFSLTRLDIAFDDHTGILDIDRIHRDVAVRNYTAKSTDWEVCEGSKGKTVYVGSKKSECLIRIYDKAKERGYDDDTHWIRVEMQLRRKPASGFAGQLIEHSGNIGDVFRGVLRNKLCFRQCALYDDHGNPVDSNKSRWPVADYWAELLQGMGSLSVWETPGVEYNEWKALYNMKFQYGSTFKALAEIFGLDFLIEEMTDVTIVLNEKQRRLVSEFHMRSGGCIDEKID